MTRAPLFVVVGPSCSGKGIVGQALQDLGFVVFELSAALPKYVAPGLGFHERLRVLSDLYHATEGRVLIDELLQLVRPHWGATPVAVIGARQLPEIEVLSRELANPIVISVYADDLARYQRSRARRRPDGPRTFDEFLHLTYWEYSLGLAAILRDSPHILYNSSTEEDLKASARTLLREQASSLDQRPPMR